MMNEVERANILSWDERINMLSVNPHAATIDDIAIMAAELSERRASALLGEAATTKEAASYIEAAEDLRAWLHEHIDVPDEIYIPFIASIERAFYPCRVYDGIRKIEDEKVAEITREIRSVKRKLNSRTVTKRGTT